MFVIFLAVIIMNLLIGLTVTSIEALNQEGQKVKAVKRLDAIVKSVVFSNGYAGSILAERFAKPSEKMKNLTNKVKRKRTFPTSKVQTKVYSYNLMFFDILLYKYFMTKSQGTFCNYTTLVLTLKLDGSRKQT